MGGRRGRRPSPHNTAGTSGLTALSLEWMRSSFAPRAVVVAGIGAALLAVYLGLGRPPRPLTLAGLAPGQELRVVVRSRGCFHDIRRSFAFERRLDGRLARPGTREQILTAYEAHVIDGELTYARTTTETGCTTVRYFDLTLSEGGRPIATAAFADRSCGLDDGTLLAFARE
jgi:hypothetical protein